MGRRKKTKAEVLERKKLAARQWREHIKNNPILYQQLKEKEKERYKKRKREKKLFPISEMTDENREKIRMRNKTNFRAWYNRKKIKELASNEEKVLTDTVAPQPSTPKIVETNTVQNKKIVITKKKQDTINKKKENAEIKKRKKVIIKKETPAKGEIDIDENPPVACKPTKTYVKNKSSGPNINFEEDIKPDQEIKSEIEITENGVDPEIKIKVETEMPMDSDQMQTFANTVALQLNNLPLHIAINIQEKIQKLIVEESVNYMNSINSSKQQ